MESKDLFKQLGLGDPDLEEARKWVSYKKFEEAVPDILTLSEFVDTVLKKAVGDDAKPHLWFSQRYMISKYVSTDTPASDEYINEMLNRFNILTKRIPNETNLLHIHNFLNTLTEYLITNRRVLPKLVLEYLNELYKTKGLT